MNYALILGGGTGSRLNKKIPKQFLEINNKPLFIYCLEKFLRIKKINNILFVCKEDWIDWSKEILKHFNIESSRITIIPGGNSRNGSLLKGLKYLEENFILNDNDIIITHDVARIFVSSNIINDNIELANTEDVIVDTCIKAIDTIVESKNKIEIDAIPNRDFLYYGQTPQTGKYKLLREIYNNKYDEYIFNSTDLCKLSELSNIKIKIVEGSYLNFKITTENDFNIATILLKNK